MPIHAHFEMQVRAGRMAGRTNERDGFAAVNLLSNSHEPRRGVAVARGDPIAVINIDIIPIAGGA